MDYLAPAWTKSTLSNGGGECVEVAAVAGYADGPANKATESHVILVRDSKNPAAGHLTFTVPEWDAFISAAKAGEFDSTELLAGRPAPVAN